MVLLYQPQNMNPNLFNDKFANDAIRRSLISSIINDFKKEMSKSANDSYTYIQTLHELITEHGNKKRLLVQTLPNIVQGKPRISFLLSGFNSIVEYPVGIPHPVGFILSLLDDSPQEMCLTILQTCYHLAFTSDKKTPVFFLTPANDIEQTVSTFLKLTSKLYKRHLSFVPQTDVIDLITAIAQEVYTEFDEDDDDNKIKESVSNLAVGSFDWYLSKIKDLEVVYEIMNGTKDEMTEVYKDIVNRLIEAVRLGENGAWQLLKYSLAHWFVENREKGNTYKKTRLSTT